MNNEKQETNIESAVAKLIKMNAESYKQVGTVVKFREDLAPDSRLIISDQEAYDVVSACRRKIKKDDILLLNTIGLAFTNDKIYFFTSKSYKYISGCEDNLYADEIAYADIVNVDYCKKYVEIITEKGRQGLRCCSKEYRHSEYSKYMYNFIMDILDCLRKTDDVL
ncbi:MAG: hypothetical protein HFH34_07930 [Eubacterium sp.]|nr:hypothetical protein [Eubacterium sp.]